MSAIARIDPMDVAALLRRTAIETLLPRHGKLRDVDVMRHDDNSLYSEADLLCEERLKQGLHKISPGIAVVGEEEIARDPEAFQTIAATEACWVIDPIDGSGAFRRGEESYGSMVALLHKGATVMGFIYTPGRARRNEYGDLAPTLDAMVIAEQGAGCELNGKRLRLDDRAQEIGKARVAFACRNQDRGYEAVLAAGVSGAMKRNNASFDYTRLLRGDVDANFYSEGVTQAGEGKCPPWDHAAGVLAVQEAGGHAALPYSAAGNAYTPRRRHDRLLAAASRELFASVQRHVETRAPYLCRPYLRKVL